AASRGHLPMTNLLIERGAPLEAKHRSGRTPLDTAFLSLIQQSEFTPNEFTLPIAAALIKAGAQLSPANLTLAAAVCLDLTEDIDRLANSATAIDLRTALSTAAYNGHLKAIQTLIGLGADVNAQNAGLHPHATPLHNAVCSGPLGAVKMLVEA